MRLLPVSLVGSLAENIGQAFNAGRHLLTVIQMKREIIGGPPFQNHAGVLAYITSSCFFLVRYTRVTS